MQIANLSLLLS